MCDMSCTFPILRGLDQSPFLGRLTGGAFLNVYEDNRSRLRNGEYHLARSKLDIRHLH
jgi:hypothetical protein